jgi:hypothetical protein
MRAAARQAALRISEQTRAKSCGDDDGDEHDLLQAPHIQDDSDFSSDQDADEYNDNRACTPRDDSQLRRSTTPRFLPARTSTRLPLRVAPANYNYGYRNSRNTFRRLPLRDKPISV